MQPQNNQSNSQSLLDKIRAFLQTKINVPPQGQAFANDSEYAAGKFLKGSTLGLFDPTKQGSMITGSNAPSIPQTQVGNIAGVAAEQVPGMIYGGAAAKNAMGALTLMEEARKGERVKQVLDAMKLAKMKQAEEIAWKLKIAGRPIEQTINNVLSGYFIK